MLLAYNILQHQERVELAEIAFLDGEQRRKAKSTSADDGEDREFNLTKTDVYFFEEIEPVVERSVLRRAY